MVFSLNLKFQYDQTSCGRNFPLASIRFLENKEFNILSISESHSGILDSKIIDLANVQQRLILTFDRDFGQLVFKEGLIPQFGILYFRLKKIYPTQPGEMALNLLEKSGIELAFSLTVIEENFISQRKF